MKEIQFIDRRTGSTIVESVMGDGALRFAYETMLGRTIWPVLFGSKFCSAVLGAFYDSPRSRKKIATLASIPGCRAEEAEKPTAAYATFNEFFTRKLNAKARPIGEGVTSPADGRLMLYLDAPIDRPFPLKGARISLKDVFSPFAVPSVERCDIAVVRLAPVDYHRFHFPCDCSVPEGARRIPGRYHSVNPIALLRHPDVYAENERQIVRCETSFGPLWLVDVGAFGVGTIVQTFAAGERKKGDEKGYFKFGGSTVVMVTASGALKYDEDLIANSNRGIETRVFAREKIASVNV